ncbi:hypothetical protein ACWD4G_34260 [Streptomyces sp. NPDC002643]
MLSSGGVRLRTRGIATGLVLSLALLTGCGGEDTDASGGGTAEPTPSGTGSDKPKSNGPAYKGPALPGFAKQAAWSLSAGSNAEPLDLGGTLLFARNASGEYLNSNSLDAPAQPANALYTNNDEPEDLTLEFRDTKTGEVRKTMTAKAVLVERTTWLGGTPAIAVVTSATTESDGLTEAKTTTTATLYDADGEELAEVPGYEEGTLLDGYRVETVDKTLRLTPVGGGAARKITCTGFMADCDFDAETGLAHGFATQAPLITGTYYAGFENATNYENDPEHITLNDLTTGKKVWSTADAEVPQGVDVDDEGEPESGDYDIIRVADGKVLVAWQAGLLSETRIDAWYDLSSGALLTAYEATEEVLFAPNGELAAKKKPEFDTDYVGTAVWQVADGKRLWAQEEGETSLDPVRFTADGSVLYGLTGDAALAVDARTREVLAKDLPEESVPLVEATTGYGYLNTDDGFFVLAPA